MEPVKRTMYFFEAGRFITVENRDNEPVIFDRHTNQEIPHPVLDFQNMQVDYPFLNVNAGWKSHDIVTAMKLVRTVKTPELKPVWQLVRLQRFHEIGEIFESENLSDLLPHLNSPNLRLIRVTGWDTRII